MELSTCGFGSYSRSAQFQEKDDLPKCQGGSQNFGQVQKDGVKLNLNSKTI